MPRDERLFRYLRGEPLPERHSTTIESRTLKLGLPIKIEPLRELWVGKAGFEPAASASRTLRATKLRYFP